MFFDIGSLEFITLIILAILVFGPEKLPKMIQEVARFLRRIREFSDSAKQDIRSELGPEFKDFDFDDLNPRRFAKKHLLDDDLGLRDIRDSLDVRKELTEVADSVNGRPTRPGTAARRSGGAREGDAPQEATPEDGGRVRLSKDEPPSASGPEDPPPFDADAT